MMIAKTSLQAPQIIFYGFFGPKNMIFFDEIIAVFRPIKLWQGKMARNYEFFGPINMIFLGQ
jgi:hypothetical protein